MKGGSWRRKADALGPPIVQGEELARGVMPEGGGQERTRNGATQCLCKNDCKRLRASAETGQTSAFKCQTSPWSLTPQLGETQEGKAKKDKLLCPQSYNEHSAEGKI